MCAERLQICGCGPSRFELLRAVGCVLRGYVPLLLALITSYAPSVAMAAERCVLDLIPAETRAALERFAAEARRPGVGALTRSALRADLRDRVFALSQRTGVSADVIMTLLARPASPGAIVTTAPPPEPVPLPAPRLSYYQALQQMAEQNIGPEFAALKPDPHDITFQFATIEPGTFTMGSPKSEKDRNADETQRRVTITKPFQLAVVPMTQWQVTALLGRNPSEFKNRLAVDEGDYWKRGDLQLNYDHPAENLSWTDAQKILQRLNDIMGDEGCVFRLPTEAEWEYAARAGTTTSRWYGDDDDNAQLEHYAWINKNSYSQTHKVGLKPPNPWGLYDILGNVWEWVSDWHGPYGPRELTDPKGPKRGSSRVFRGGSWLNAPRFARSAQRGNDRPEVCSGDLGFRVACFVRTE